MLSTALFRVAPRKGRAAGFAILTLLLPAIGAGQCVPANSAKNKAEIDRLQDDLRRTPADPVRLYIIATDYAAECDDANTLDYLRQTTAAGGGLDPDAYRGFAFLHDTPEFQKIVADIRRRNPPRIQSTPAYTIKERDLFPEGMAYASFNGRVYAGSIKGKIIWTDKSGEQHDFARVGQDGLAFVLGLRVDERRRQLWAVSSTFDSAPSSAVTGLFRYDIDSRKLLDVFPLPSSANGFLNDVVVDPASGVAYTTNTSAGNVYVAAPASKQLAEFLPPDSIPGANGIAFSHDAKVLFVAGDFGITRVDPQTRAVRLLETPRGIVDASIDGLYFYRQSLVGIQNGIHPGRVVRFYLDPTLTKIVRREILETYNPLFENPTTGALDGDSFLFMANPQLHKASPGKPLPPVTGLHDISIRRIALKRD